MVQEVIVITDGMQHWLLLACCASWAAAVDWVLGLLCGWLLRVAGVPLSANVYKFASGPRVHVDSVGLDSPRPGEDTKEHINEQAHYSGDNEQVAQTEVPRLHPVPIWEDLGNFRGGGPTEPTPRLSNAEKRRRRQERLRGELERLKRYDQECGWFQQGAQGANSAGGESLVANSPPHTASFAITAEDLLSSIYLNLSS